MIKELLKKIFPFRFHKSVTQKQLDEAIMRHDFLKTNKGEKE